MLSKQERERYNRQIILPEIGEDGQEKLKQAKVLVIGAGGLGCPILLYLTAAGVGTIGIMDADVVSESNLHRQVLYTSAEVNLNKAICAAKILKKHNPFVNFDVYDCNLTKDNALQILEKYDIVVDGSDNFATRYLTNDAAVILNKPLVYGAIFKFDGQVTVFNYQNGPTYRCIFPEPPLPDEVPSCSEVGVLGVLPGIIGTWQANETIKIILEKPGVLSGKMLTFDALEGTSSHFMFTKNAPLVTELIDYESFCGIKEEIPQEVKKIDVHELSENREDYVVIDVREAWEYEVAHIENSILIPFLELPYQFNKIKTDKKIAVLCHHGIRSAHAIRMLQADFKSSNLYNVIGGIDSWSIEIDDTIERY